MCDEPDNTSKLIIDIFKKNIFGKSCNIKPYDCSEGQWLEQQFGIKSNSKNAPDIYGYELKKDSKKITFGDWSATEYIYSKNKPTIDNINKNINITKDDFFNYFGTITNERLSWSGNCIPSYYNKWSDRGQIMLINKQKDILLYYSYKKDIKALQNSINIPECIRNKKYICLAIFAAEKMKKLVETKFNNKGFIICGKNKDGIYDKLSFGRPINYDLFLRLLRNKQIIFDSGMYKGNTRNYSIWRASNTVWNSLIYYTSL